MTAFAACLLALAGLASICSMIASLRRFGPIAHTLRAQLRACPGTMAVEWRMVERVAVPALASIRKRPARRAVERAGLEWPGLEIAA